VFSKAEYIVSPSGSCTAMVKNYYPTLFENHRSLNQAQNISKCIFEFSEFLIRENQLENISGEYRGRVGFHNSCHSYRELGITDEPLKILNNIDGIEIVQPAGEPVCCGFGGLFSFKYDQIASTMAKTRLEMFTTLGAETVVTNDPGCLMHMRQEAIDRRIDIELLHLSEFLVKAMNL
jgi:L-lactate dehydrogenase complex protein LldE